MQTILRFVKEDDGQDVVEYALLAAFIGVCAVLAWTNIPPKILNAYTNWDNTVQGISGCTPDPGGGGC